MAFTQLCSRVRHSFVAIASMKILFISRDTHRSPFMTGMNSLVTLPPVDTISRHEKRRCSRHAEAYSSVVGLSELLQPDCYVKATS